MESLTLNAQGGLANRMRAIASAVSLAKDIDTNLKVIWQSTAEMTALFEDLFEQTDSMPNVDSMSSLRYNLTYEIPRKRNFFISSMFQYAYYKKSLSEAKGSLDVWIEKPDAFRNLIKSLNGNVLITSGLEFYDSKSIHYNQLFRPIKSVREIIGQIAKNFDSETYGIHIRRTDNRLSIENSPLYLFEDYIKSVIKINENARFYIASDDYEVKENLNKKFGDRLIMSDIPLTRTTVEGTMYALAEMYALASTQSITGSYWSSFSEIAARLGNIPLKVLTKI